MTVPLSFGLIMAGFAGHAVFPTVYRDMENPKLYNKMVNWTYVATTFVYFGVAACGYLMFGSNTMQEVKKKNICFFNIT
jgi:vesicular inhibitory amino acid transporter